MQPNGRELRLNFLRIMASHELNGNFVALWGQRGRGPSIRKFNQSPRAHATRLMPEKTHSCFNVTL